MTSAPAFPLVGSAANCSVLLGETYRRLGVSCQTLRVRVAAPGARPPRGWADAAELAARPELLDAVIDAEVARIEARYDHTPRRDVAASRAVHDYLWSVCVLMGGAWYREGRVPRVRPRDVRIDLAAGGYEIVPGDGFTCLPGDPAARLRGARIASHAEALRTELRAAVADHVRPLLAAIGPRVRRGPRALWGMVGDDLVSAVWHLGRVLGEEERALRMAGELLPRGIPPFPGGAGFRWLAGGGGVTYPTRTRLGCCLHYTIRPAEACLTCPRTGDDERLRRLAGDAAGDTAD